MPAAALTAAPFSLLVIDGPQAAVTPGVASINALDRIRLLLSLTFVNPAACGEQRAANDKAFDFDHGRAPAGRLPLPTIDCESREA